MTLSNFCYGTFLNFESFRRTNHTVSCCDLFSENHFFLQIGQVKSSDNGDIYHFRGLEGISGFPGISVE